jgi:hypothetical protein
MGATAKRRPLVSRQRRGRGALAARFEYPSGSKRDLFEVSRALRPRSRPDITNLHQPFARDPLVAPNIAGARPLSFAWSHASRSHESESTLEAESGRNWTGTLARAGRPRVIWSACLPMGHADSPCSLAFAGVPACRERLALKVCSLRSARSLGGGRSGASDRWYHIVSPCESADMQLPRPGHGAAQLWGKLARGTIKGLRVLG